MFRCALLYGQRIAWCMAYGGFRITFMVTTPFHFYLCIAWFYYTYRTWSVGIYPSKLELVVNVSSSSRLNAELVVNVSSSSGMNVRLMVNVSSLCGLYIGLMVSNASLGGCKSDPWWLSCYGSLCESQED